MEASDGSGRLHIARFKTDQEARGHVAYLAPTRPPAWKDASPATPAA